MSQQTKLPLVFLPYPFFRISPYRLFLSLCDETHLTKGVIPNQSVLHQVIVTYFVLKQQINQHQHILSILEYHIKRYINLIYYYIDV